MTTQAGNDTAERQAAAAHLRALANELDTQINKLEAIHNELLDMCNKIKHELEVRESEASHGNASEDSSVSKPFLELIQAQVKTMFAQKQMLLEARAAFFKNVSGLDATGTSQTLAEQSHGASTAEK